MAKKRSNAGSCASKNQSDSRRNRNTRRSSTQVSYKGDTDRTRDEREAKAMQYNGKGENDYRWYAADESIAVDAARGIPFNWATGTPIDLDNPLTATIPSTKGKFFIPGIQALRLVPTVGVAAGPQSPINVAATNMYTVVRRGKTGYSYYNSPDIMIMTIAFGQIYSYITFLMRAYGVATLYAQKNRYFPRCVLFAMGINPEDIRNNLGNFRYGINLLINKVASFAIPANIPYFQRMAFLYQNIYTEGTSVKDQCYMYVPDGFYRFAAYTNESDGAGYLQYEKFYNAGTFMTVSQLLAFGDKLLAPLLNDDDINIMSADMLAAYGSDTIKLQSLPDYYPIVPVFDIGVLEQMKNATVIQQFVPTNIVQNNDKGYLVNIPQATFSALTSEDTWANNAFASSAQVLLESKLMTTTTAEVTPALILESSRLMVGAGNYKKTPPSATSGYVGTVDLYCGTEVAVDCQLWGAKVTNVEPYMTFERSSIGYVYAAGVTTDPTQLALEIKKFALMSHFRFHPAEHVIDVKQGSTGAAFNVADSTFFFDVDNYGVATNQVLRRLHETVILNLLSVPRVGTDIRR